MKIITITILFTLFVGCAVTCANVYYNMQIKTLKSK